MERVIADVLKRFGCLHGPVFDQMDGLMKVIDLGKDFILPCCSTLK